MSGRKNWELYIVIQVPKPKYRASMSAGVVIVEAPSGVGALRIAAEEHPNHITVGVTDTHKKPQATRIMAGCSFTSKDRSRLRPWRGADWCGRTHHDQPNGENTCPS